MELENPGCSKLLSRPECMYHTDSSSGLNALSLNILFTIQVLFIFFKKKKIH